MSEITWTLRTFEIATLTDYFKNPRSLSKEQFAQLKTSLDKFGMIDKPIVNLDAANTVIGGHQRLHVLRAEGVKQVECWIPSRLLDEREVEELNIRLNKATGAWDFDVLANAWELTDLLEWGFSEKELQLGGFDLDQPEGEDPGAQIDKAEELREKWGVETGQLWKLGEHRLICGDSKNPDDVNRLMNGESAVLFATDPPYGVAYNDETGDKDGETIANDENDGPKLQAFLEDVFRTWLPHLDNHAAWYLWHAQLTQGFFAAAAAAAAADILIHRQIIWVKPSLIMGHGDYHWRHELCFYGWRKGYRPPFYGERNQTTIWEIGKDKKTTHPTEKPPELWEYPMKNNSKTKQVCAEPFCGSGSQIIAGEMYGRKVYACELDPKWVATAIQRWCDMTGGTPELVDELTLEKANGTR